MQRAMCQSRQFLPEGKGSDAIVHCRFDQTHPFRRQRQATHRNRQKHIRNSPTDRFFIPLFLRPRVQIRIRSHPVRLQEVKIWQLSVVETLFV